MWLLIVYKHVGLNFPKIIGEESMKDMDRNMKKMITFFCLIFLILTGFTAGVNALVSAEDAVLEEPPLERVQSVDADGSLDGITAGWDQSPVEGNLLIAFSGHRVDYEDPYLDDEDWDLNVEVYADLDDGGERRAVAMWSKIASENEPEEVTVTWDEDEDGRNGFFVLQEFQGPYTVGFEDAATAAETGVDNETGFHIGTTSAPSSSNVFVIGGAACRDGGDFEDPRFDDENLSDVVHAIGDEDGSEVHGVTGFTSVHDGDHPWETTLTWDGGEHSNVGFLALFALEAEEGSIGGTVYGHEGEEASAGEVTLYLDGNEVETHDLSADASYLFEDLNADYTEYALEVTEVPAHQDDVVQITLPPGEDLTEDFYLEPKEAHELVYLDPVETMTAGNEEGFTIQRLDEDGDEVTMGDLTIGLTTTSQGPYEFREEPGGEVVTEVVINDGESAVDFYYYDTDAGEHEITGQGAEVESAVTTLTVESAELENIAIEPQEETTTAGGNVTYNATAYDVFDNEIGDVTEETNWSIEAEAGGGWDANEYTSEFVGDWAVYGEYKGSEDTAHLTVEAADLEQVTIYPSADRSVSIGEELEFTVEGNDRYGNLITDDVTEFEWENISEVDGEENVAIFYEEKSGEYDVSATFEGVVSPVTTLTVEEKEKYDLTISIEGEGSTEPEEGTHTYEEGEEVTVEAISAESWAFSHWSGDVTSDEEKEITIVMDEDKEVTVHFKEDITKYNLTINEEEGGTTDPEHGTYSYPEGEMILIRAVPEEGWNFTEWSGDVPEGEEEEKEITIVMDEDKTLTAHFIRLYGLTVDLEGQGDVELYPDEDEYEEGTEVVLTAEPEDGWKFVEWTGEHEADEKEISITIEDDISITVHFEEEAEESTLLPVEFWLVGLLAMIVPVILLFFILFYNSESHDVSVTGPEDQIEMELDRSYTYDFVVTNHGKGSETYELAVESSTRGWKTEVEDEIVVEGESDELVLVNVDIPRSAEKGESSEVCLRAVHKEDEDVRDHYKLNITYEGEETKGSQEFDTWRPEKEFEPEDVQETEEITEATARREKPLPTPVSKEEEVEYTEKEVEEDEGTPEEISKEEALEELKRLKGVGSSKAENLYEEGYRSIEDMKDVSKEDLKEVKGIGPSLSRKILNSLEELKKEK